MKKIRCLSIDIDGTLIKENAFDPRNITDWTLQSIGNFCTNGKNIVLSTGRDLYQTLKIAKYVEKKIKKPIPYLICMNGCVIFNNEDKKNPLISEQYFDFEACREIVKYLSFHKFNFFLVNSDGEMFFDKSLYSRFIYTLLFRKRYKKSFISRKTNLKKIQKIMIFLKTPQIKRVVEEINSSFEDNFYCSAGPKFFIEIIDKNVNKFYALQQVAQLMGIDVDSIATIGNEANDVMSLENCGYGIGVDLDKKESRLSFDKQKIQYFTTNKHGNAVALGIQKLQNEGLID